MTHHCPVCYSEGERGSICQHPEPEGDKYRTETKFNTEAPMIHVLEADHYREARKALAADDIVRKMASEVPDVAKNSLVHEGGGPRFEMMQLANGEYEARGGTTKAHIGAVAEAIIIIWKEGGWVPPSPQTPTP